MIVRTLDAVTGTDRDVTTETWRSRRLVLAAENPGFSLHETVMYAGTETRMWYANHVEAVYVIEGHGELVNEDTGERHALAPGTMYLLNGHEHHAVRAQTDVRTVCAFNPPVTGREVHDGTGAYPLIAPGRDQAGTATEARA
jgi:L-ectoine synthase